MKLGKLASRLRNRTGENLERAGDAAARLDEKWALSFHPWWPVIVAATTIIIIGRLDNVHADPSHWTRFVSVSGAIMICAGIVSIARPILRLGGYRKWLSQSKSTSIVTSARNAEVKEDLRDAYSVNIIGPILVLLGTLLNGAAGYVPWLG